MTSGSPKKLIPETVAVPAETMPAAPRPLGDPLSVLYLRYRQDVIDFVRRKFGPGPPEPEDVAQAVFLQLAAHGRTELIQNPRSFLLKSAQNVVLDHRRSTARRLDQIEGFATDSVESMSEFDTEHVVMGTERLQRLVNILGRQPAQKRQMVLLSRIHGLSCEEIGRRLGVSAEAVQKQIERVLKDCLTALQAAEK